MSENEKTILSRARNGDMGAFELLIDEYQKKIFNIALRMIGNYDDASELAQEVLIRIYRSIGNFKEESQFSTWVYKIATNVCLDELRKRKNRKTISLDEEFKFENGEVKRQIEDDKPLPEAIVETNEIRKEVNKAIMSLSEEHRTVIILRDIQGFSYEEIAKIIKCNEGTVKSRISRARQSLKDLLKSRMELFKEENVK